MASGGPPAGERAEGACGAAAEFGRVAHGLEDRPLGPLGCAWSWFKFVPAVLVLLPLRVLLLLLTFCLVWLLCQASLLIGCCRASPGRAGRLAAHSPAQRALLRLVGPLLRLQLLWLGFLWIPTSGAPARWAPTVVANHVTQVDGLLVAYLLGGRITAVAQRWVTRVPFLSALARAHHVLAVGGGGAQPAKGGAKVAPEHTGGEAKAEPAAASSTDLIGQYQRLRAEDSRHFTLLVFPEGYTKAERCLIQFRTGAFVAGLPVQPLVLRFPVAGADISWVQQSLLANALRVLTQWVNRAEAAWLEVYSPSEAERRDPRLYADNVQRAMAVAMGLPPERFSSEVGARELRVLAAKA